MKCEDLLPSMETGGVVTRWLARRHAAQCPRCAAELRQWRETKKVLLSHEPLSTHSRRLWTKAAELPAELETAVAPRESPRWSLRLAAVACSVLLLSGVAWVASRWWLPEPKPRGAPNQVARASSIREIDPREEFSRLETGVAQLERELAALARDVERLDARRELDETLEEYRLSQE